jgi:hypothetical protein
VEMAISRSSTEGEPMFTAIFTERSHQGR